MEKSTDSADFLQQIEALKAENKSLKAENKIQREALERYSALMDIMQTGVLIEDADRTITEVNQKFCDLFGIPDKEMVVGADCGEAAKGSAPYFADPEEFLRRIETILEKSEPAFNDELELKDERTFERDFTPVYFENGFLGNVWLYRDVTRFKANEKILEEKNKQLDLFFNQSLMGFFFMPLDEPIDWQNTDDKEELLDYVFENQRVTRINQAMLEQYGAKEEDFIGVTPTDFFAHDIEYGRDIWKKLFDNGRLHIDTDERRLDGTNIKIEGDYVCLYDEQGRITGHFGVQQEVTQRKLVEETFRELYRNAPIPYQSLDADGRILKVNKKWEEETGYALEEAIGMPFSDILTAESKEKQKEHLKKLQTEGEAPKIILDIVTKSGAVISAKFESCTTTIDSEFLFTNCVFQNITEKLEAERQLKESETNFRTFFNSIDSYLFILDTDGNIIEVNQAVKETLNYDADELKGQSVLVVHPEERRQEAVQIVAEMLQGKRDYCSVPLITKQGKQIPVETSVTEGEWNGKPVLFGVSKDISKLKASEEKFSKAYIHSPAIMGIAELDTGVYIDVNPMFCEKFGFIKADVIGRAAREFVEFEPGFRDKAIRLLKAGKTIKNTETTLSTSKGQHFEVLVSADVINISGKDYNFTTIIDITDRKKAESELQRSANFTKSLLQAIPVPVFFKDKDLKYLGCNDAFTKYTGKSEADIVGKTTKEVWPSKLSDMYERKDAELIYSPQYQIYEFNVKHRSGQLHPVIFAKDVFRDENGLPAGIVGSFVDISERKMHERELQAQKNRLRNIIEGTNAGTWQWNVKTNETVFNERWANIIGYSLKELEPVSLETWMKHTHPDDLKRSEALLEKHFKGETDYYELEARMKHKNGEWVWVLDRGKVIEFDTDGSPLLMYGTHQDITDRMVAELQLREERNLFSSGPVCTIEWDPHEGWPVRFVSENVTHIIGYTVEEMTQPSYRFGLHIHPDDIKKVSQEVKSHINSGQDYFEQSYRYKHKNGQYIWIYDFTRLVCDEEGNLQTIRGYLFDQSEQKASERKIITLNKELRRKSKELRASNIDLEIAKNKAEESDRLKSAFLANMSHEIRTPMNAVIGFAHFLKNSINQPDSIERYAEIIINSGTHLLNLINDIIDISKIDAGQVKLFPEDINLHKLLDEIYRFFHSELIAKEKYNVQIFVQQPQKDVYIHTDETRLRQILINLLGNAVKFTREGYIEFGYTDKGDHLLFFVKDTGIGISEAQKKHIFKRFVQANPDTEKIYGGTGLGLSIAKACAELLNGKIYFESYKGKGTTFYFTIEHIKGKAPAENEQQKQTESKIAFKGEKVLVAEDDDLNYEYLAELLKRHNLSVIRTKTGKETIKRVLENEDIQLLLLDIQMPEGNGWEVAESLRKQKADIPIIAQSAYAFKGDKKKSLEAGCNDYIAKPIEPDKMFRLIHRYMFRRE